MRMRTSEALALGDGQLLVIRAPLVALSCGEQRGPDLEHSETKRRLARWRLDVRDGVSVVRRYVFRCSSSSDAALSKCCLSCSRDLEVWVWNTNQTL